MVEYVSYENPKKPKLLKFGKYSFSTTEIKHLSVALVMITLTLMALDLNRVNDLGVVNFVLVYFLSVGLGFLLHELGHKLVAQHYGYISEFRADFIMLFVALLMAYFFGFVFLAPGAVMILGRLTTKENGIVSVAGPFVNLVLATIFALIAFVVKPNEASVLEIVIFLGIWINAFLGIFNMLPFWILDGKKVLAWNKKVYFLVLAGLVFFLVGSIVGWFL